MLRSTSSVLALLAAMTVPAIAADYPEWGDEYDAAPEFRDSYSIEPKHWTELGDESDPIAIDPRTDPAFTMADTPLDMRVLDSFTEALRPLVPALGDTPVAEHRGGLFTMTPDRPGIGRPVSW